MTPPSAVPHIHTAALPPDQEAAVLFARGRAEEVRAFLERLVGLPDVQTQPRLWTLLFTLYRIQGQWPEFDDLAARFQSVFRQPAPAWLSEEALGNLPRELRAGGDAYIQFAGALDQRAIARLQEARDKAGRHASVHLDLSRIEGIDAEGATALSGLIRFLASHGTALLLTGTDNLTHLLRAAVSGDGSLTAYWTLLLDLYQLDGSRVEFERAAVEYALSTGAPVPEWEAVVMPLPPRMQRPEQRDEPRYQAGPELVALAGALTEVDEAQLTRIEEFASARRYVNIDLAGLDRIAPAPAGALVKLVNALASAHVVRLLRPNALVEALLETLALDPRVQLIRAKSL